MKPAGFATPTPSPYFRVVRSLVALALLGLLGYSPWSATAFGQAKGIWDGNGTEAKSGVEGNLGDEGNSDGKSGLKEPPQTFFIPPQRQFEDVDPDEMNDARGRDYTPYAIALFTHTLAYRDRLIPRGHYQIKLGGPNDGSQATRLTPQEIASLPPSTKPGAPAPTGSGNRKKSPDFYRTFIFKQLGKVVLVLPIHRREAYHPPKGQKKLKNPLAVVVFENHQPVLKLYYRDSVYSTVLEQPGVLPN